MATFDHRTFASRFECPEFYGMVPAAAVFVLWLNDAVLKARYHNAARGKLSDFAGCFVLPLFLSALLAFARIAPVRRVRVAAGATVILFSALKLSSTIGAWVCALLEPLAQLLGAGRELRIVADSTDLFALTMVPLAAGFAKQRSHNVR
jgi:hypothetical protein